MDAQVCPARAVSQPSAPCRAPASSSSPPRPRSAASARRTRPGATSARGSRRPESCPARRRACAAWPSTRRPGVRPGGRPVGAARDHRRALQPAVPPGTALAVLGRERQRLRRGPGGTDPRRRQPRPRQPRALSAGLHRVRGIARRLQGLHLHPHPARRRARLCVLGGGAAQAKIHGRGLSALLRLQPLPTRPASWWGASDLDAWVHLARSLDCALLIDEFYSHYVWASAERPPRQCGRATSRTSTRTPSCSSTGSPRTGATRAGG